MFRLRRYRVFLIVAVFIIFALYKLGSSGTSWPAMEHVRPGKSQGEDSTRVEWQPNPKVAHDPNKLELDIPAAKSPQAKQTPPPAIPPVDRPVDEKPLPSPKAKGQASKPTPSAGGILLQDLEDMPPTPSPVPIIHWKKMTEHFPVPTESLIKLPTAKPKPIPKIQFDFKKELSSTKADRERKLNTIRDVFKRSWNGYKKFAWLQDELMPSSGSAKNPFAGWGATLVDALDTLWIMGLKDEFDEAAKAVDKIDFTTTTRADIPLFETTIRYMGGLLAAYDVSGKKYSNLLVKAEELAEVLLSAFDTPNRMPETYYYWRPDFSINPHRASNRAVLAEIGSMSMEFTHLAQLTGKDKYYDAIARITDNLEEFQKKTRLPGMWPTYIDISGCKRVDYSSTYNKPLQNPIVKGPSIPQRIPPTKAQSVAENVPLSENPDFAPAPETVAEIAEPQEDPRKDKTAPMVEPVKDSSIVPGEKLSEGGHKFIPLKLPPPLVLKPEESSSVKKAGSVKKVGSGKKVAPGKKGSKREPLGRTAGSGLNKRQLDEDEDEARRAPLQAISTPTSDVKDEDFAAAPLETRPLCEKIGFESTSTYIDEEYTLGGMSDSTYEYLPKQYLLLGGVEEKYRTMYEAAVKTIKENILFRPMLPDNKDILVAGKLIVSPPPTTDSTGSTTQAKPNTLDPQQEHLTCFAGGMFGMGAKIFNSPDDLDIARKLTEGCIWSYKMTATKIMPEGFQLIPCQSMKTCEWNQTKYWDTLDPWADSRLESYKESKLRYEEQMKSASSQYEQDLKTMETPAPTPINRGIGSYETEATPTPIIDLAAKAVDLLDKRKRQLDDSEDSEARRKAIGGHLGGINDPPTNIKLVEEESPLPSKILPVFPHVYSPKVPASQEEYVETRIIEERLPIGVTRITGRNYILRPEAIESVWYMYRITGDPHYREAGWSMFEAINAATAAEHGNSAIEDVTQASPVLRDEMESFWLSETLKYFYLLFMEEREFSLDEWVFNTEAHPFRRPK